VDVAVASLSASLPPRVRVPALPLEVPRVEVFYDLGVEVAVALARLALLDAYADGLAELAAANPHPVRSLCCRRLLPKPLAVRCSL
jgi:hypothetical protein